jgi:malonyl-CoA O-methyltransferase
MTDVPCKPQAIQRAFSKAAPSYAQAAVVQQHSRDELLSRLPGIRLSVMRFADVGCATGQALPALAKLYPEALGLAVDFALPMLKKLPKTPFWQPRRFWPIAADMNAMPLPAQSLSLLFSNLALQWSIDVRLTLREWQRLLAPQGLLLFATLSPLTLQELRQAWSVVEVRPPPPGLVPMENLGDWLLAEGLEAPVLDAERLVLTYASVLGILKDLQAVGAIYSPKAHQGLLTKNALNKVEAAYRELALTDGRLPLTYEILYGIAWQKAQPQIRKGQAVYISFPPKAK